MCRGKDIAVSRADGAQNNPGGGQANASPNQRTINGTVAGARDHYLRNLPPGSTRVLSIVIVDLQHHWMQGFEGASDADSVVQGDDDQRPRSKAFDRFPVSGNYLAATDVLA